MTIRTFFLIVVTFWLSVATLEAQDFNFNPDKPRVKINKGSRYTRTNLVSLQLVAFDAIKMQVSNYEDFRDAFWIPYQGKVYGFKLLAEEGDRTVYARFRGKDGSISEVVQSSIHLDRTPPPNPKIEIIAENKMLNDTSRLVNLKLSIDEEETYMMVSNSPHFFRKRWQVTRKEIEKWELDGKLDGEKTVYAKFRDRSGNVTQIVRDKVTVDTQGPVRVNLIINGGNEFTTHPERKVQLTLMAIDVHEMLISNQKDFTAAEWQPFKNKVDWQLTEGDGEKNVYAKFRDKAKNESGVVSDNIYLDTTPPENISLTINDGAGSTSHPDGIVQLTLNADGATFMMISNDPNFRQTRWQPYEELVSDWKLFPVSNGTRTVYVKFKDDADNVSEVIKAEIVILN